DGGQSSLNYLFGGGQAPKPALKATQAAPCETPATNTKYCSFSQGAPELLESWTRQDILQLLCTETGKDKK
nr:protein SPIRAL1-like 1 [Tanacetum cinerariifolium]